jgi:hypothetical protein
LVKRIIVKSATERLTTDNSKVNNGTLDERTIAKLTTYHLTADDCLILGISNLEEFEETLTN